jgi:hypothetical protein
MPAINRLQPTLNPVPGRFAAKTRRFVAMAFSFRTLPVAMNPFVVISCVAGGPAGAPLCFTGQE